MQLFKWRCSRSIPEPPGGRWAETGLWIKSRSLSWNPRMEMNVAGPSDGLWAETRLWIKPRSLSWALWTSRRRFCPTTVVGSPQGNSVLGPLHLVSVQRSSSNSASEKPIVTCGGSVWFSVVGSASTASFALIVSLQASHGLDVDPTSDTRKTALLYPGVGPGSPWIIRLRTEDRSGRE